MSDEVTQEELSRWMPVVVLLTVVGCVMLVMAGFMTGRFVERTAKVAAAFDCTLLIGDSLQVELRALGRAVECYRIAC